MTPAQTTRINEILQRKIKQVQQAEIEGKWQTKTIEQETEFLILIKALIQENQELSINNTPDINSEKFIDSFVRELDYFDLRPVFVWNEVRLMRKDFSAYND